MIFFNGIKGSANMYIVRKKRNGLVDPISVNVECELLQKMVHK